jgi:hypothetical protein
VKETGPEALQKGAHLEVDVLQSSHDNSVHAILGDLEGRILAQVLIVQLTTDNDVIQSSLILKSFNIFRGVRVDALEGSDQLVIQSLNV